ncbi:glycoside-pentoside-hexuronide (GPH):cation symporter [Sphingomonas sp. RB3P16]|uniref:MFS transporter n=1 Tax=Parasphingomonas frigoris TaxID=3096163 RepID=UPI002FCBC429
MAGSGTSERLRFGEKLSYGLGDFAFSIVWNVVGAFLLFYYTDVARLPAAAVGTLFLTARLLDAGVDIGVGVWVDKTRTRWGRTRPFFLFNALPFALIFVATFLVPDWSMGAKLAYAYITFNLLGILFSLGTIPYSALMPMMTANPAERLQLGSYRSVSTALSVIVATAATMPLVGLLGRGDARLGFALVAGLFAIVSLVLIANLFRACKERVSDATPADFAVLPAVGEMLRNRAWLVTFVFAALNFVRFGAILSVTAYFAITVLRQPWMISVLLPGVSGTLVLGAFIAPPILRRTGIRNGCLGAIALAIALYLVLPTTEANPGLFIALFLAASISISVTMTAIFTMAADSVDYHEWRFARRNEGLLSSGISLSTKLGMAIGSAAVAYTLAATGYAPGAVNATAAAAIRWSYYGWPIGVLLAQAVCILFWPMDGLHGRIRAVIAERSALIA